MKNNDNYCIIMAGGIGSRFWPISRTDKPKQFLDILKTGKTLIQQTFERFEHFCPKENILIVTSSNYEEITLEQLPFISANQVLLEPARRNTAPCIAYANEKIRTLNPNANIIVAPSDHIILNEDKFRDVINRALEFTRTSESLVTIGLRPTRPDTGYGYIQYAFEKSDQKPIFKVKTFTEKPNLDLAKIFLDSGDFLWNSGIFVWNLQSISKAFNQFLPDISSLFSDISTDYNTDNEKSAIENVYAVCKNISIDYGIMEKAQNVHVVAADFGWSDLGTWGSLYEQADKDSDSNVGVSDKILAYDSKNCIVDVPEGKLVIMQGLDGYIVAESGNSLLICKKEDEQSLRDIVTDVKKQFGDEYI
ncbi:MAG: mannose-1-phosphate guanylyltransferase [Salinivirgaceae bacterium]|nr:mannose-1-phosphate guanylyltransferase [Salinivirgaceae bacterium]